MRQAVVAAVLLSLAALNLLAASYEDVQTRIDHDRKRQTPLVAHVIVALCDNKHQGIVPVSATLGNGQDPANNLYWGAMYGVRSFLPRSAGWRVVSENFHTNDSILQSFVATKRILRDKDSVDVYLVAEAWDGRFIRGATMKFLDGAGGSIHDTVRLTHQGDSAALSIGGDAHLICYIGHNGLMDFSPSRMPYADTTAAPRSAIVLACVSRGYFEDILRRLGAHPLLLTNGFMAPEAYTLDAAVTTFFAGQPTDSVHAASAAAYAKYQKCSLSAARSLFFPRR